MDSLWATQSWLLLALPLAGFLGGLPLGRRDWRLAAAWTIACNCTAAIWGIALAATWMATVPPDDHAGRLAWAIEWFALLPDQAASIGAWLDPISVMMIVVVTVIASLVHIYSVGYMRHDPAAGRFFPLLSFFVFSMLGLVMASNLLQMFVFWELVGVASYLLIGFWYRKPSAVAASKKAFIVTRFADAFFLLGIIGTAIVLGRLDFAHLADPTAVAAFALRDLTFCGLPLLTVATCCLFAGGWGKSAMFPLHIWLPDAMEGPTPVSSIIHSATMVVAGVYLTARLFPLFAAAEGTLLLVETTGAITALFAAVIACTQLDIKRILAFSTLSQLGYMMFALGVASPEYPGGYTAAMFHVFTHAWFKCLLFLGAGLVIHAVHSNSLAQMGGLRQRLPLTWITSLIACLAIAGFPFTSGWFSKDAILIATWDAGHPVTFGIGLGVGALTAYYMFRYLILAFHGSYRGDPDHLATAQEDRFMVVPMLLLALPSLAAGFCGGVFLQRVVPVNAVLGVDHHHPAWIVWAASGAGILGIACAWIKHGRQQTVTAPERGLGKWAFQKFFIDEAWLWVTRRILFRSIAEPAKWTDDHLVDGSLHRSAGAAQVLGSVVRFVQNGQVHRYLGAMVLGLILLAVFGGFWPR